MTEIKIKITENSRPTLVYNMIQYKDRPCSEIEPLPTIHIHLCESFMMCFC